MLSLQFDNAAFFFGKHDEIKCSKGEARAHRLREIRARVQREIIWAASTRDEILMRILAQPDASYAPRWWALKKTGAPSVLKAARGRRRSRRGADLSSSSDFFCAAREQRATRTGFTSTRAFLRAWITRSRLVT